MKKMKWLMPVLAVMLMLIACNKDEDSSDIQPLPEKPETTAPMEVAIVFEPGQLGSMCTNDYLLKDVEDMANAYPDSLASTFFCRNNYAETNQALKLWASQAYGTDKRRHRLLILTSPSLARAMEGVQLQSSDHLLMLRTYADSAKQVGPAGRSYVLNVSYADAVRQAVAYRSKLTLEEFADTLASGNYPIEHKITIMNFDDRMCYADSLVETLLEIFPEKKAGRAFDVGLNDISISSMDLSRATQSSYLSEVAYTMAYFIWEDPVSYMKSGYFRVPIQFIDWGTLNRSYEWYIMTHLNSPWKPQAVVIGEYDNNHLPLDYIVPKYALKSWLLRWMAHPYDMPEEEWSGKAVFSRWQERI